MAQGIIEGSPYANAQGSNVGAELLAIVNAEGMQTDRGPSYQLCKDIYQFHPLGAKIANKPIELAQSAKREITITGAGTASDKVRDTFELKWKELGCDALIANTMILSRVYGAAAIALLEEGRPNKSPVDFKTLYKKQISFNVYDPLNVAGSLVLNQDPLSPNFLHITNISVNGEGFHRSRARVMQNEEPLYISWTNSTYGYSGRSVYQRALLPLKSFIQTMITDDMISRKAGVIVAKQKQQGSIVNQAMRKLNAWKRNIVKEAEVGNVISISTEESIESIDLKNLSEPYGAARKNIIENIASAVPMPAQLLTEETFGGTFHEGSEDAKSQARFVTRIQEKMDTLYVWMDQIVMRLAWTPEFFYGVQSEFPDEFQGVEFEDFFWRCANSFKAIWPSLLKEPDSELVKVDKVKLESVIEWVQTLLPNLPQEEKAKVIMWACDQFNELKILFAANRLDLDYDAIANYSDPTPPPQIEARKPLTANDSIETFQQKLLDAMERRPRLVKG